MNEYVEELKWNKIVYGIILILVGVLFWMFPEQLISGISLVVGVFFIATGVAVLIGYAAKRAENVVGSNRLLIGVILVSIGIFAIVKTELIVSMVPFILGFIVVASGVNKLQTFIDLKRLGYAGGIPTLVLSVLNIAFGIVLIANPFEAMEVLIRVIGAGLIFSGITDLVATIILQKKAKDYMVNKAGRMMRDVNVLDAEYEEADK